MSDLLVLCPTTEEMQSHISEHFRPTYWKDVDDKEVWLESSGAEVEFVLTDGHLGVQTVILEALENVLAISSYGVGYDAIDTDATNARGIPVSHTPNVLNDEVATSALMLYLAAWRNLEAEMTHARSGAWEKEGNLPLSRTADGRRIGIVGLGRIGKSLAAKLEPFGCEICYYGRTKQDVPYRFFSDLVVMASECDTLISILPGGDSTRHLIGKQVIEALGSDGCLINVGRGSVVDEVALVSALAEGRLGRAGLDVFEDEPRIPSKLRDLPNVVLTPHIGSATIETRRAMGQLSVENLRSFKQTGKFLTPVPESLNLLKKSDK